MLYKQRFYASDKYDFINDNIFLLPKKKEEEYSCLACLFLIYVQSTYQLKEMFQLNPYKM